MKFGKLVRDKIPDIIRSKGETAVTHIADDTEYQTKLREKVSEELAEFDAKPCAEEMADLQEVCEALTKAHGISWEEVQELKKKKREERGGFEQRIILDETT